MRAYLLYLALLPSLGQAADLACPTTNSAANLENFRTQLISKIQSWSKDEVVRDVERCFPSAVPACLRRAYRYASTSVAEQGEHVSVEREMEMRLPPKEMLPQSKGPYWRQELELLAKKHDPAQSFVLSHGEGSEYMDIETLARVRGWPMVRYKSRHSGGFDGQTASLLMIRVPGEKMVPPVDYDRYINIALPEDPNESKKASKDVAPVPVAKIPTPEEYKTKDDLPNVFTIVSVRKPKAADPARVFFSKFERVRGTGEFKFNGQLKPDSCYSCHPSGLRAISPLGFHVNIDEQARKQMMADDMWKAVKEMNDSMEKNMGHAVPIMAQTSGTDGKTRVMYDMGAQGPVYGPVKPLTRTETTENGRTVTTYPTRTKEFIVGADGQSGCAAANKNISLRDIFGRAAGRDNAYSWIPDQPVNWVKIRDAMECESCHNGHFRGTLNGKTEFSQIQFKILVDQSMPLGAHHNPLDQGRRTKPVHDDLNNNERMALSSCLDAEFRQEKDKLPAWLAVAKCRDAAPDEPASSTPDSSEDLKHQSAE